MKYMIMIYSNPKSRAVWEGFTDAEREEGWNKHRALVADIAAAGDLVTVEGLADPETAKRVTVRDGQLYVTDGPYAETKEYLAGFFLVDCASEAAALAYASRIPEANAGLVEVRAIVS